MSKPSSQPSRNALVARRPGRSRSAHPTSGKFALQITPQGALSLQAAPRLAVAVDTDVVVIPSGLTLHSAILREGTSVRQIKELADQLGLSEEDLGRRCGLSRPTLHRRKKARGTLSRIESDLWTRYALLFKQAVDVFESEDAARAWLRTSQAALGDQAPLDLALSSSGFREVEKLLTRIDHGVYA